MVDPEPLPISDKIPLKMIESYFADIWKQRWEYTHHYRQTKLWFSQLDQRRRHLLMLLPCSELGVVVQAITEHNFLNRHLALMEKSQTKLCRLCLEEEETAEHVILTCPAVQMKRWKPLHQFIMGANWYIQQLCGFLREPLITKLFAPRPT